MCICHYCSILGLFIGEIFYAAQKLIQCLAVGSVFTCLMFTFTVILMLGVGLGYNHAYVEIAGTKKPSLLRNENNEKDADAALETSIETPIDDTRIERSQNSSSSLSNATEDYPLSPTMVIPLRSKNILQLIRKIRKQRTNVTLEIVAT